MHLYSSHLAVLRCAVQEDHYYVTQAQQRMVSLLATLREQQAADDAAAASSMETGKERAERVRHERSARMAAELQDRVGIALS